jgi:hypothetical protein
MGNGGAEQGRRTLAGELESDRGEGERRLPWLGGRVAERMVTGEVGGAVLRAPRVLRGHKRRGRSGWTVQRAAQFLGVGVGDGLRR